MRKDYMCDNCSCGTINNVSGDDKFSIDTWKRIDSIINNNKEKPEALISILKEIQEVTGYLPEIIQRRVSEGLGAPLREVHSLLVLHSASSR